MQSGEFDGLKGRKHGTAPIDLSSGSRDKIVPAAKNKATPIHSQPHLRTVDGYSTNSLLKIHMRGRVVLRIMLPTLKLIHVLELKAQFSVMPANMIVRDLRPFSAVNIL